MNRGVERIFISVSPPDVFCLIKSRRKRWAGHMARMKDRIGAYKVLVGDLKERDCFEELGVNENVI